MYEDLTSQDQVAPGLGPHGPVRGAGVDPRLLLQVLATPLHPAPTLRPADAARVPQGRLSRAGADPHRMGRTPRGVGARLCRKTGLLSKGAAHQNGVYGFTH